MIGVCQSWEKLGRIVEPNPNIHWMSTYAAATFPIVDAESGCLTLYVTGRDKQNRSLIGRVTMDLNDLGAEPVIDQDPLLGLGNLGAFDENGVSYPCVVESDDNLYLYYTGWMPTILTPFTNQLGLAVCKKTSGSTFRRISRAPILPLNDEEYLGTGSVCVFREGDLWRMYYTSFLSWEQGDEKATHQYVIKYAESSDGIEWKRTNKICIDLQSPEEHSICRPSVFRHGGHYHMYYCFRGDHYRLGYAHSNDGVTWTRRDDIVGIDRSDEGWDSMDQCYPSVFQFENSLWMIYNGNEYGKTGLGLAQLRLT